MSAMTIGRRQSGGRRLDASAVAAAPDRVRGEPVAVVPAQSPATLSSQHTASFAEILQQLGI